MVGSRFHVSRRGISYRSKLVGKKNSMAEPRPYSKNNVQPESTLTFEESLLQLEASVRALEAGDLELERAIEVYIKGVEHVKACQTKLSDVEQRLEVLVQTGTGGQISNTNKPQP